jgi:hypothetical protein
MLEKSFSALSLACSEMEKYALNLYRAIELPGYECSLGPWRD